MGIRLANFQVGRLVLAVTLGLLCPAAYAQDGATTPELKQNPMAALQAFEPAANQEYELGRGDEITIEVVGRPELSGKHVVGPDGRITLPVAGSVLLADKTREQAGIEIQSKLNNFYSNTAVSVGVDKYTSNHVLLLGAVEHPGLLSFDESPTLLEVISRGGQPLQGPAGTVDGQKVVPNSIPERCAIYRGNASVMWIQLRELVDSGSPLADMRLKRDDVVFVPSSRDVYISVMGEVGHPGTLQLERTSTLPKLLAEAGGPNEKAGRNPKIQIIQQATGKTRIIAYKDVLQPSALDLTLHSGDIIYVPQSNFDHFGYQLQQLSPLITLGTFTALAAR